jgi:putative ABC transport system permease protein
VIAQFQALVVNTLEQGALAGFLGLGVLITFRFFRFPDLTAEGSYPLGGAVAASLLLDEHLANLDPRTAAVVLALTGRSVAEAGLTTLMVTHNMARQSNGVTG